MCLLLRQALEPQQLWPRPPWWHHRQHLLMRAPCGSLLCPPLALASPLAWLQLVRVLARALLPADASMASLASLRWQMTCEVCCCCPWHSWSPWRFMAWWLPWCFSSPTHSSSERPNPEAGRARNLFSEENIIARCLSCLGRRNMLDTVWASLRNYSGGCNVGCRNIFYQTVWAHLGFLGERLRPGFHSWFGSASSANLVTLTAQKFPCEMSMWPFAKRCWQKFGSSGW